MFISADHDLCSGSPIVDSSWRPWRRCITLLTASRATPRRLTRSSSSSAASAASFHVSLGRFTRHLRINAPPPPPPPRTILSSRFAFFIYTRASPRLSLRTVHRETSPATRGCLFTQNCVAVFAAIKTRSRSYRKLECIIRYQWTIPLKEGGKVPMSSSER